MQIASAIKGSDELDYISAGDDGPAIQHDFGACGSSLKSED